MQYRFCMDTKEVIVRQARHNMFVSVQVTSESSECKHKNVVDCKIKKLALLIVIKETQFKAHYQNNK